MDLIKTGQKPPLKRVPRAARIIVSIGDSYSSGEGIEPFLAQNSADKYTASDFLAHRSEECWPGKLILPAVSGKMADNRGENWFIAAASGAKIKHIWESQSKTARILGAHGDDNKPIFRAYPPMLLAPQLDIFKELGKKKADYVTLTLGGNDVGFSEMITQAMVGHTYVGQSFLRLRLVSLWNRFFEPNGIRDGLLRAYRDIAEAAGPQARIIVAGYPKLFGKNGSRTLYSRQAAALLNSAISDFNAQVEYLVSILRAEGIRIYFVSVEKEFEGHEAYAAYPDNEAKASEIEYIHRVILGAGEQDIDAARPAYAGSMHPNARGAEVYRACVQKKINELEAGTPESAFEPLPAPDHPATAAFVPKAAENTAHSANEGDTADRSEPKKTAIASKLPIVIGGAAALVSIGAIVGTTIKKQKNRAIAEAKNAVRGLRDAVSPAAERKPEDCGSQQTEDDAAECGTVE